MSIDKGADFDMQNRYGETILHTICQKGLYQNAKLLIRRGASTNILNFLGESPMHKAVQCQRPQDAMKIIRLLVKHGGDWSLSSLLGTPLSLAIAHKAEDQVVEYLSKLKKKSDLLGSGNDSYKVHVTSSHMRPGPSLDNIDIQTLLGIRSSQVAPQIFTLSSEEARFPHPMVIENSGFAFEFGSELSLEAGESEFDLSIEDDNLTFDYGMSASDDVANMIGWFKNEKEDKNYYYAINVLKANDFNSKYRGVIRTLSGDHRFFIPSASLKSNPHAKDFLKLIDKELPEVSVKGSSKLVIIDEPKLHEEFIRFEKNKMIQTNRMKIGVLYIKKDQTTESEVFANDQGSEAFEDFLDLLGEKIELKGWKRYKGDLDTTNDSMGVHSRFTQFRKFEIMYHVSTYLRNDEAEDDFISKKRCIGNDLSCIVYLEEGATFTPPCVSGDFLHIFAVVQRTTTKDGKPGFMVAFVTREGVPPFGPPLPKPAVFPEEGTYFRDFLLTKLLNGERASLHSPHLVSKMYRSRQMFLEHIVQTYSPQLYEN